MKKKGAIFLLALIFLILLFSRLTDPAIDYTPAPENLESMEVYQMLRTSVSPEMTLADLINAFGEMCEIEVDCQSDSILFEYMSSISGDAFSVHLARQFEFYGEMESVQLHMDLLFPTNEAAKEMKLSTWYSTDSEDITRSIQSSEGFQVFQDCIPTDISVSIDWTW